MSQREGREVSEYRAGPGLWAVTVLDCIAENLRLASKVRETMSLLISKIFCEKEGGVAAPPKQVCHF